MKAIKLFSFASIVFVGLAQPAWADPHGGGGGFGGGGHFSGVGRVGGFAGGGSRAAPGFYGGGLRAAPAFRSSGTYFTGRSVGGLRRAPHFYYGGTRMSAVGPRGVAAAPSRSISPSGGRVAAANRQPNRVRSISSQNRVSDPRTSTAANRQSFLRNHAFERHEANNWHRDWDRHRAHFHNNRVFVFIDGFWWGLYPWEYYPYYGYGYPYDYSNGYPYDYYNGYPYDYYNGYYPNDYYQNNNDNDSTNTASDQYASNPTLSAVQSKLANLGYYQGPIDGVLGDRTQAALARYQEDHGLSVTGTLTTATLQSLGLPQVAS
jgi:Putative peptidoglycan binding domain